MRDYINESRRIMKAKNAHTISSVIKYSIKAQNRKSIITMEHD